MQRSRLHSKTALRRFVLLLIAVIVAGLVVPVLWLSFSRRATASPLSIPGDVPGSISVASINMAKAIDIEKVMAELDSHPTVRDADVLFLQEVVRVKAGSPSTAEELAARLNRRVVFASPDGPVTDLGLAILSRFTMHDSVVRPLRPCNLVFRTRKRIALGATLDTLQGAIRVINAHLDTRISPSMRAEQLRPIIDDAQAFSGPVIFGGDLNTNDMEWFARVLPVPAPGRQADAVRKLMHDYGFTTGFGPTGATFDHLGMQLDWIFSRRLKPLRASVQPLEFSDHHAIHTVLVGTGD